MTYTERWDSILEAILGAPATPEQKTMYENGISFTQSMAADQVPWDEATPEQKAEVGVNYTHSHLTGLASQYEYNKTMMAATDSAKDVNEILKQTDPTPAAARASKAAKTIEEVEMSSVKKGLSGKTSFSRYSGNVKSEGGKLPSGKRSSPKSGGKVKSSLTKTAVKGNPGKKG